MSPNKRHKYNLVVYSNNIKFCSTMSQKHYIFVALFSLVFVQFINCETNPNESKENEEDSTEVFNETDVVPQDLYVIKTIVYEVGILTDVSNDTDNSTETHHQVDVSFYDSDKNGTLFDLSNIPLPVQTNVSGVSVTGLLPSSDLVSVLLPPGEKPTPILPKKQITVTQNISTSDPDKGSEIILNLPQILGLTKTKNVSQSKENKEDDETDKE